MFGAGLLGAEEYERVVRRLNQKYRAEDWRAFNERFSIPRYWRQASWLTGTWMAQEQQQPELRCIFAITSPERDWR